MNTNQDSKEELKLSIHKQINCYFVRERNHEKSMVIIFYF